MKGLNIFKMIKEATVQVDEYKAMIENAETYDEAKKAGLQAVGYVNCLITMSNTMICMENNGITQQLDSLENQFLSEIFQAMADNAQKTNQPTELLFKLFDKRDEYHEASED